MLELTCSNCKKIYTTNDKYLQRVVLCPHCAMLKTIPKLFHKKRFENLKITPKNEAVIKKIKDFDKNTSFVFYGGTGTGKTTLLYAHLMKNEISGFYVNNWISILDTLKAGFGDNSNTIEQFLKSDFLFIDDLGAEKISDWGIEQLYKIINHRYENMLVTGITTNLNFETLSKRYGDRITSRIKETYKFVLINSERWR